VEDAIAAKMNMNGCEISGTCIKIGYAKVPNGKDGVPMTPNASMSQQSSSQVPMEWQDSSKSAIKTLNIKASEFIYNPQDTSNYASIIPPIPEATFKIDPAKMKEFRKRLEGANVTTDQLAEIFNIVIQDVVTISAGMLLIFDIRLYRQCGCSKAC
jgi:hypothetical protein